MSNFTLADESLTTRTYIRAWEPGDGLTCHFAKRAPREQPCGQPVVVALVEEQPITGGYRRKVTRTRVVCRNHVPGLTRPSEISAEAKKAAVERVIVEHWDDYQRYIAEETVARQEKALEFADPEIRAIILGTEAGA